MRSFHAKIGDSVNWRVIYHRIWYMYMWSPFHHSDIIMYWSRSPLPQGIWLVDTIAQGGDLITVVEFDNLYNRGILRGFEQVDLCCGLVKRPSKRFVLHCLLQGAQWNLQSLIVKFNRYKGHLPGDLIVFLFHYTFFPCKMYVLWVCLII